MMKKTKARLLVAVVVGLVIWSASYFVISTEFYGVPSWWILRDFHQLSSVQPGLMVVSVTPTNPTNLNEQELAYVRSESAPISNASITVFYGGAAVFNTQTNNSGEAVFAYAGSPTIISVTAQGYTSVMSVLPSEPEQWVNGTTQSNIIAIVLGVATIMSTFVAQMMFSSRRPRSERKIAVRRR
jgi:hypothetical protein